MKIIGDKKYLAFEIGPYLFNSIQQQIITIWVGNKRINPIDNHIYLPSFYTKLSNEIERLEFNEYIRSDCNGMQENEIFDRLEHESTPLFQILYYDISNIPARCYFIELEKGGGILFQYVDQRHKPANEIGRVFSIEISKNEVLKVMKEALDNLSDVWV